MRLTKEITEELVKEVAGEDTVKLVDLLKDQENISEFKLAEKLRLTVNTVRNMLYRLQAHNLVTSTRKKDKKKGWYIYYWTFNIPQAKSLIRVVKTRKLEHLKDRLRSEIQESFYICPQKCVRFKMENAMDYDFKCPECGNVLEEENNMDFILKIKNTITELEGELSKPTLETRTQPKTEELVKRGRPKLSKRGRPRLVQRGRPKLVARGRPKLSKRGRPRLVQRGRPKLVARGRPKLNIVKKPKLKLKQIRKPKIRKIRTLTSRKIRKPTIRKLKIAKTKMGTTKKKLGFLKKLKKVLRRKR